MKKRLAGLIAGAAVAVACGQTDAGITTAVKAKLAADDTVKAYQVNVDTRDHVVTLSGEVDSPAAETVAIQIARDTQGVRDVVDNIRLVLFEPTTGVDVDLDDDLTDAAKDAADATKRGAKKVGEGVKQGAAAIAEGAKKAGSAVKDAVTDDDRDSDKDGR